MTVEGPIAQEVNGCGTNGWNKDELMLDRLNGDGIRTKENDNGGDGNNSQQDGDLGEMNEDENIIVDNEKSEDKEEELAILDTNVEEEDDDDDDEPLIQLKKSSTVEENVEEDSDPSDVVFPSSELTEFEDSNAIVSEEKLSTDAGPEDLLSHRFTELQAGDVVDPSTLESSKSGENNLDESKKASSEISEAKAVETFEEVYLDDVRPVTPVVEHRPSTPGKSSIPKLIVSGEASKTPYFAVRGRKTLHGDLEVRSAPTSPADMAFPKLRKYQGIFNLTSPLKRPRDDSQEEEGPATKKQSSWAWWWTQESEEANEEDSSAKRRCIIM